MARKNAPRGNPAGFDPVFRKSLRAYLKKPGESQLGHAYELGRQAMAEGKSLTEIVFVHHQLLGEILAEISSPPERKQAGEAAAEFFAEVVSPYEMARRGFQEAVNGLRQMNETLEGEIKKIAYAVHDEAGQQLVAVHLAVAELARDLPEAHGDRIESIQGLLRSIESEMRKYSHELRPMVLDDLGCVPAIRFLAERMSERTNVPITVKANFSERLPGPVETAFYRIVQEALNNAAKHAKAKNVRVGIQRKGGELHCAVQDDGVGFDIRRANVPGQRKGLGMVAMRERVTAIGGTLTIHSAPGHGTRLLIRFPMESVNGNSNRTGG